VFIESIFSGTDENHHGEYIHIHIDHTTKKKKYIANKIYCLFLK